MEAHHPPEGIGRVEDLFAQFYDELRGAARAHLRRERDGHTLQTTALVHEAYLRLRTHRDSFKSKSHFLALAAISMRRVLIEHARARLAKKRGSRPLRVTMRDGLMSYEDRLMDVLALDEALESLAARSSRSGQVAEMRLFAGMSVQEISSVVGVSPKTVKEDWRLARAWLSRRLRGRREGLA